MSEKLHRSAFIKEMRVHLPAIEPWLVGYRRSLHLEVMRFCQFTTDAIQRGDFLQVRQCFEFAAWALERANHYLRNAIAVSYLEHLELSVPNGETALKLMPPVLAAERRRVLDYVAVIAASSHAAKQT